MATMTTQHSVPTQTFDVAVIGAGINGLAVAREAVLRGLTVAVIERDDIGARTSSISTRLIHGGLKYMERLDFRLVFESIRERSVLLKQAPHLVHRYPMLIPFYRTGTRPGWLLACGLLLHDVLSVGKPLPLNRIVGRRTLQRDWPSLDHEALNWAGVFEDANVPWTERLCIELALSASDHGALFFTHTTAIKLTQHDARVTGILYRDNDSGQEHTMSARTVVNAAGPWVDEVLGASDVERQTLVGPTKGSHAVVDAFPGAPDSCVFFEARADGRPMFIMPWAGRYMLGTTDIAFDGDLESIAASDAEIDYLLKEANALIPQAKLTDEDVLWSYAGVRPLPYTANLSDPSKVTRDHQILDHSGEYTGLLSVIGGKLTTHRALGKQTVDKLIKILGRGEKYSRTRHIPFPGAPEGNMERFVNAFIAGSTLPDNSARRLASIYGTRASLVQSLINTSPELAEIVDPDSGALAAEVVFSLKEEGARSLEDILLRRILVGLNADVGVSAAPRVAQIAAKYAGWSEDRTTREIAAYFDAVRRFRPRADSSLAAQ